MNCPDFETLMMMLDGELQEKELEAVAKHVLSCSKCRVLIDSQRKLETSWRDDFVEPDSKEFRDMERSIFNRINRHWRWKALIPAAAGIIAVLLGVKLILNNQPSLDRVIDFSSCEQMNNISEAEKLAEKQGESLPLNDDELFTETSAESTPIFDSSGELLSAEDVISGTFNDVGYDGVVEGESAQTQSEVVEACAEESLRGAVGSVQEIDRQIVTGGAVAGSGGGGELYSAIEESEEFDTAEEIVSLGADDITVREESAEISGEITLSLDTDTAELETVLTVSSTVSVPEEMEDNRASDHSAESYTRFYDFPGESYGMPDEGVYIELAFDANGIPDSITALILDSLFVGWSDYIPFYYRDTVLIVPVADVQDLFMDGNVVPAETIE